MQDIVNRKNLETLLLKHWADFLHVSKLIQFAKNSLAYNANLSPKLQVFEIKVSRFELTSLGFLIWLEIILTDSSQKINATIEAFLSNQGELQYVDSILS